MKKIICMIALVGGLLGGARAWAFDAAVSSVSAAPGQAASVKVTFTGNSEGIYAVDAWLTYDAGALRLDSVTKGSTVSSFSIATNTAQPGLAKIALYGDIAFTAASGELLIFNFTVLEQAQAGSYVLHLSKIDFSTDTAIFPATVNTDGAVTVQTSSILRLNVVGDGISGFVNISPAGTNCPRVAGYPFCKEFPFGTTVTLTPNAMLSRTRFASWSLPQCPGRDACTVDMNQPETRVTATFANSAQLANYKNGDELDGTATAFSFDKGSRVDQYRITVVDISKNLIVYTSTGLLDGSSAAVSKLPGDGSPLKVKILSRSSDTGVWLDPSVDYDLKAIFYGDVNVDGSVTAIDASMAARNAVGTLNLSSAQVRKADVNNIAGVTASDASWIARKAVGSVALFPIEQG
jgi:hypothetical protein